MHKRYPNFIAATFMLVLCFIGTTIKAQSPTDSVPKDPGSLSVYTVQNMSFGAFATGSTGGSVVLSSGGTRSATGTVLPLNMGVSFFQAIFEIEGPPGTVISILNGPDATLTGSNGGSMSLQIGTSNPAAPFSNTVPPPGRTLINFGGTLTVGNNVSTIPGSYTGTFYITFNQE
jgi:hypothetical protein